MEGSEAWYAIVLVVPQRKAALVERVVGHLNNEKAAPPSLLEQSCGQGMHIVVMADITHLPSLF